MTDNKSQIVTRFAPSPTGFLHVGGARSALFNYIYAKQHGGKFILRIEDTDKERSEQKYEDDIMQALEWLGLEHDELYRQSERVDIHRSYIQKLIDEDKAYISKEDNVKEGARSEVIRFRNPGKVITFTDLIRGEVTFDTTELGDFVIAKDMDTPLFHLVVVVDDHEMGVTHLIRGEDHISNTPRQILIQEAIGAKRPIYAHLPLVLGADKSKLSKRHGALSTNEYRGQGYLPEAMNNFLALIGWNPGTDEEVFTLAELVKVFDLAKVQKGGGVFNQDKLDWINKQHIGKLSHESLVEILSAFMPENLKNVPDFESTLNSSAELLVERISNFGELKLAAEAGELDFYFGQPEYEAERLYWKKDPNSLHTQEKLDKAIDILQKLDDNNFTADSVKRALWDYAEEVGRGNVLWPMRYALSGQDKSPDPFTLAALFGKQCTLERLTVAREKLV